MNPESFKLTIEQMFTMRTIEQSVKSMPRAEMEELLVSSSLLLMVKDNLLRDAIGKMLSNGIV